MLAFTLSLVPLIVFLNFSARSINTAKSSTSEHASERKVNFAIVAIIGLIITIICSVKLYSYRYATVYDLKITVDTTSSADNVVREMRTMFQNNEIVTILDSDTSTILIKDVPSGLDISRFNSLKEVEGYSKAVFNLVIKKNQYFPLLHKILDLDPDIAHEIIIDFHEPKILTSKYLGYDCYVGFKMNDPVPKLFLNLSNADDQLLVDKAGVKKQDLPDTGYYKLDYLVTPSTELKGKIGSFFYDAGYTIFPESSLGGATGCGAHYSQDKYEEHDMSYGFFNTLHPIYLKSMFFPNFAEHFLTVDWEYRKRSRTLKNYIAKVNDEMRRYLHPGRGYVGVD
jgi:hypothetical protein